MSTDDSLASLAAVRERLTILYDQQSAVRAELNLLTGKVRDLEASDARLEVAMRAGDRELGLSFGHHVETEEARWRWHFKVQYVMCSLVGLVALENLGAVKAMLLNLLGA